MRETHVHWPACAACESDLALRSQLRLMCTLWRRQRRSSPLAGRAPGMAPPGLLRPDHILVGASVSFGL